MRPILILVGAVALAIGTVATAGFADEITAYITPSGGTLETEFVVAKVYGDDNLDPVSVGLVCTSGNVTNTPQDAAPGNPAVFNVVNYTQGTTCTATENPVPDGYFAYQGNCFQVQLPGGQIGTPGARIGIDGNAIDCTINNYPTQVGLVVHKDFTDAFCDESLDEGFTPAGGPCDEEVTIEVTCSPPATVEVDAIDNQASEDNSAFFVISYFTDDTRCTATENPVPDGYSQDNSDCVDLDPNSFQDFGEVESPPSVQEIPFLNCTIYNDPNFATVYVFKEYSDDNTDAVTVILECTSGFVDADPGGDQASPGNPAIFYVDGFNEGATCTAHEEPVPDGYIQDASDCELIELIPGMQPALVPPNSCFIYNFVGQEFIVHKVFSEPSNQSAFITLVCSGGSVVTPIDPSANNGDDAEFMVEPSGQGVDCTATEDPLDGWVGDESDCDEVDLYEPGECTIYNDPAEPTATPSPTPSPSPTPQQTDDTQDGPTPRNTPIVVGGEGQTPTPPPTPTLAPTAEPTDPPVTPTDPPVTATPTDPPVTPTPTIRPTQGAGEETPTPALTVTPTLTPATLPNTGGGSAGSSAGNALLLLVAAALAFAVAGWAGYRLTGVRAR